MKCVSYAVGVCGAEQWLTEDESKCVGSCFLEDDGKYRSSANSKCVSACEDDEFLDSFHFDNPVCKKCTELPLGTDQNAVATNSIADSCDACSKDGTICTSCTSGYLRTDKVECVLSCQNERTPAYLCANKTLCVYSCASENTLRESPTAYTCVTSCASGSYNNNGVCTPCTTTYGTDCSTCTVDGCTTCGSSKYLMRNR